MNMNWGLEGLPNLTNTVCLGSVFLRSSIQGVNVYKHSTADSSVSSTLSRGTSSLPIQESGWSRPGYMFERSR